LVSNLADRPRLESAPEIHSIYRYVKRQFSRARLLDSLPALSWFVAISQADWFLPSLLPIATDRPRDDLLTAALLWTMVLSASPSASAVAVGSAVVNQAINQSAY
jgi:hypothetical protein